MANVWLIPLPFACNSLADPNPLDRYYNAWARWARPNSGAAFMSTMLGDTAEDEQVRSF